MSDSITTGEKLEGQAKIAKNRAQFDTSQPRLRKPSWIRVRIADSGKVAALKDKLRSNSLTTVCEEASCPNLHECFAKGTATFMILGEVCTRRCSFCDVAHGRPKPVDQSEASKLAETIKIMQLSYVVITSVDRDDLRDGGAQHYADCISQTRKLNKGIKIEILTPDFRGRNKIDKALDILEHTPPDVFNHNIETVHELYPNVRPGADYQWSLNLLKQFAERVPQVPTKSGIMLGLGENMEQVQQCLRDLRAHGVSMVTIGQYLQPTIHHHPVMRYWTPEEFDQLAEFAKEIGFIHVASGPMVRSSYHADLQAGNVLGLQ